MYTVKLLDYFGDVVDMFTTDHQECALAKAHTWRYSQATMLHGDVKVEVHYAS